MTNSVHRPARIVALLTLVVVMVVLLLARGVGASTGSEPDAFVTHQVVAGDTLWDIASSYAEPGDDVRKAVFHIQQANDLDSSVIVPGQELLIPTG